MEREHKAKDGNTYTIRIDDDGGQITVQGNECLGRILLSHRLGDDYANEPEHFHITHLALDSFKRIGLGQACLELHREVHELPLTAGWAGYGEAPDGSHLTGDGPAFIEKMRQLGIVCRSQVDPAEYEVDPWYEP
ncbi:hypothetical protein D9M71_331580 [compost metagenome]|jgi:hypothetical protein